MIIKSWFQPTALLLIALFSFSSQASVPLPEQLVRDTTAQVLNMIRDNQEAFRKDPSKMYAMVDATVLANFDFDRMTDLALGRYKSRVNDTQKPQLVQEFRTLLVRTYGKALLDYNDQEVVFLPTRGDEASGKVTVRTEIEQQGGFPIPLEYQLYRQQEDSWKVYDISVDSISLVTNYRSSFAREIRAKGIDGLIELLKTRNADAK